MSTLLDPGCPDFTISSRERHSTGRSSLAVVTSRGPVSSSLSMRRRMPGLSVLELMRDLQAEWLGALASLVEHESPSRAKPALDGLARKLAKRFESIGGEVELIANPDGGDHVRARFFGDGS